MFFHYLIQLRRCLWALGILHALLLACSEGLLGEDGIHGVNNSIIRRGMQCTAAGGQLAASERCAGPPPHEGVPVALRRQQPLRGEPSCSLASLGGCQRCIGVCSGYLPFFGDQPGNADKAVAKVG